MRESTEPLAFRGRLFFAEKCRMPDLIQPTDHTGISELCEAEPFGGKPSPVYDWPGPATGHPAALRFIMVISGRPKCADKPTFNLVTLYRSTFSGGLDQERRSCTFQILELNKKSVEPATPLTLAKLQGRNDIISSTPLSGASRPSEHADISHRDGVVMRIIFSDSKCPNLASKYLNSYA